MASRMSLRLPTLLLLAHPYGPLPTVSYTPLMRVRYRFL